MELITAALAGLGFGDTAAKLLPEAAKLLFGEHAHHILEDIQTRLKHVTGIIPPNHDLEHAIRLAELTASLIILDCYRRFDDADRFDQRTAPPNRFVAPAQHWLHHQIGLRGNFTVKTDVELLAELEIRLDHVVTAHDKTALRAGLAAAEAQVWQNLVTGAAAEAGGPPPPEFHALFFGESDDKPGWCVVFQAFMREVFKKNPRAEIAYVTTRLGALRPALDRIDLKLDVLIRRQEEADIIAAHRHDEVLLAIARKNGIDPVLLAPIFADLGERDLTADEMRARATDAIAAMRARANQPVPKSNDGADITAAIGAARDRLDNLDSAGALALLAQKRAEEEATRRQRLMPLLQEEFAIHLITYDPHAAEATLHQLLTLDPDRTWDWINLGDRWITMGSLTQASRAHRAAMAIAERLAQSDPANTEWQRDLSISHERIGDLQRAQGDLAAALTSYRAAMAIRERLAQSDPANTEWQRDLSISHERIGDLQRAQGDLAASLTSYRAAMAIAERLTQSDPANTEWQRDLSISHNKIGDLQRAQGDLAAALTSYRAAMAIRERLAQSDPANTEWQRDLSISHSKIGDLQRVQGDLAASLTGYRAAMAIAERLAQSDPANTEWQRDLGVSHERIGSSHIGLGQVPRAIAEFEFALSIYQRLIERNPDDLPSRLNSVAPLGTLGRLKGPHGRPDLEAALAILQPLAAAHRLDATRLSWIPSLQAEIAKLAKP